MKLILKRITFLMFMIILITGCSNVKDKNALYYPELLPDEDEKYSIQAVGMEVTREMLRDENIIGIDTITNTETSEELNSLYPKFELEKSPAFLVFDENGLALKTYNYEQMIKFLKGN